MTRATGRDGLHDVLRQVGRPRRAAEARERVLRGDRRRRAAATSWCGERRAIRLRVGGERALHRRRRGGPLPRRARGGAAGRAAGGVPGAGGGRPDTAGRALRPHPRARSRPRSCTSATASTRARSFASWSARERSCAASCAPAAASASGATWRSCAGCAGPRWRPCARRSSPPSERRLAAFLPAWQGVDRHARAGAGVDRLREVLVPLQGLALPVESWERDVLPRRTGAYSPTWLDELCASGELVWVGAGPLGRSGRVALYFREDAPAIGPPLRRRLRAARPAGPRARAAPRRASQRGPCFFSTCSVASTRPPRRCVRRCGTSSGPVR